jgi:hypothetical protein
LHVVVNVAPPAELECEPFCRLEPGIFRVRHGGTVRFRSSCGRLTVFFPTPNRTPKPFSGLRGPLAAVPGTRAGRALKVAAGSGVMEYPFAVYCHDCNCFGKGSLPRMLVGP